MPYTFKPKTNGGFGSFAVLAVDAHDALDIAKGLTERGVDEIEILYDGGAKYDLAQLEYVAGEAGLAMR